jgi:hypothetical protein
VWLDAPACEALAARPPRERSAFVRDAIAWYAAAKGPLERLAAAAEFLAERVGGIESRLASLEAMLAGQPAALRPGGRGDSDPELEEKIGAAIDRILGM